MNFIPKNKDLKYVEKQMILSQSQNVHESLRLIKIHNENTLNTSFDKQNLETELKSK